MSGNWAKEVFFSDNGDIPIWTVEPRPADSAQYYNFTSMAMALNEFPGDVSFQKSSSSDRNRSEPPSMEPTDSLPFAPTDSRYRLDIRLLEEGDIGKQIFSQGKVIRIIY